MDATTAAGVEFPGRAVRSQDFHMPLRDYPELVRRLHRSKTLAPDIHGQPSKPDPWGGKRLPRPTLETPHANV
jgi:hypothetical protein